MFKGFLTTLLLLISTATLASTSALVSALKEKAQTNNGEASYHLGMLYNNGVGVDKSPAKALEWFKTSAQQDDPLGHYKLGCYYAGQFGQVEGLTLSPEKALKHKMVAAEAGYSLAQYDVGAAMFRQGKTEESLKWTHRAAEQGYPNALSALAALYQQDGAPQYSDPKAYEALLKIQSMVPANAQLDSAIKAIGANLDESTRNSLQSELADWQPSPSELTQLAAAGLERAQQVAGITSE